MKTAGLVLDYCCRGVVSYLYYVRLASGMAAKRFWGPKVVSSLIRSVSTR